MSYLTRSLLPNDAITVSNSQIDMYMSCQTRHNYAYKLGVTPPSTKKELKGTVFHNLLWGYYSKFVGESPRPLSSEELSELYQGLQERVGLQYVDQLLALEAFNTFIKYLTYWPYTDDFTVIESELEIFADSGLQAEGRPIYYQGIIDLLVEDVHGDLVIEDHKTSESKNFYTNDDLVLNRQMLYYYMLLRKQKGVVPKRLKVRVNNINTYPYKKQPALESLFFRTLKHAFSDAVMQRFEAEIHNVLRQMYSTAAPTMLLDYRSCKMCRYQSVCTSYLEGSDVQPQLELMNTRKETFNFIIED